MIYGISGWIENQGDSLRGSSSIVLGQSDPSPRVLFTRQVSFPGRAIQPWPPIAEGLPQAKHKESQALVTPAFPPGVDGMIDAPNHRGMVRLSGLPRNGETHT